MEVGLILDVEGVIVDTEAANAEAGAAAFRVLCGLDVRPQDFRPFIGAGAERFMGGVADKYGLRVNLQEAVELREGAFFRVVCQKGLFAFPGALDLVREARDAPDFRLAAASSASAAKVAMTLNAVGLNVRDFDAVVTADDLRHPKPGGEVYTLAARWLSLPVEQCVVIEDAPAGVLAARNAGALGLAVTHSARPERLRRADRIVESLTLVNVETLRSMVRRRLQPAR